MCTTYEIYLPIDDIELSHTVKVVLTLVEHLKNKGYDLYRDQFYTTPALADRVRPHVLL